MSRSHKKAIIKDRPRNNKKSSMYWRVVRRVQKLFLRQGKDIPSPKVIYNDYDYSDYTIDCENNDNCYCIRTYGRKKCKEK
jgi:hypothetical protein